MPVTLENVVKEYVDTRQSNPSTASKYDTYRVTVDQYRIFRENGFLAVRGLVSPQDIADLLQHTEDLMQGRLPEQQRQMLARDTDKDHGVQVQGLEAPPEHLSPDEKAQYFLRIH